MSKLYHRDVFLPAKITKKVQCRVLSLTYSRHALEEANSDRFGTAVLPETLDTSKAEVIEVELNPAGFPCKAVYRVSMDVERDLVIVVSYPNKGCEAVVRTVWINLKSDKHKTLNKIQYVAA